MVALSAQNRALLIAPDDPAWRELATTLQGFGFQLYASSETAAWLTNHHLEATPLGDVTRLPPHIGRGVLEPLHPFVGAGVLTATDALVARRLEGMPIPAFGVLVVARTGALERANLGLSSPRAAMATRLGLLTLAASLPSPPWILTRPEQVDSFLREMIQPDDETLAMRRTLAATGLRAVQEWTAALGRELDPAFEPPAAALGGASGRVGEHGDGDRDRGDGNGGRDGHDDDDADFGFELDDDAALPQAAEPVDLAAAGVPANVPTGVPAGVAVDVPAASAALGIDPSDTPDAGPALPLEGLDGGEVPLAVRADVNTLTRALWGAREVGVLGVAVDGHLIAVVRQTGSVPAALARAAEAAGSVASRATVLVSAPLDVTAARALHSAGWGTVVLAGADDAARTAITEARAADAPQGQAGETTPEVLVLPTWAERDVAPPPLGRVGPCGAEGESAPRSPRALQGLSERDAVPQNAPGALELARWLLPCLGVTGAAIIDEQGTRCVVPPQATWSDAVQIALAKARKRPSTSVLVCGAPPRSQAAPRVLQKVKDLAALVTPLPPGEARADVGTPWLIPAS